MTSTTKLRVGRFYRTPPTPCPYLPGRDERKVFTELEACEPNADAIHDLLATAGFRRSHNILYRPSCDGCSACVPVRIDAQAFRQSRNMRAVWRRNAGIRACIAPAIAAPEQYRLFRRYQETRHGEGYMARMSFAEYRAMIEDSPLDTFLVEYRAPDGSLTGVCLTDRVGGGLSMVYSFFDPEDSRTSPGTYMILWHLDAARREGLGHLYLGYWIAESPKMAYKRRFAAIEALGPDGWHAMSASALAS